MKTRASCVLSALLLLPALLLLSCASGGGWSNMATTNEFDFAHMPGPREYPDAGALILLDEGGMEIVGIGDIPMSVFERHRVVRVLNASGRKYANVMIPYSEGSRVEGIQARTIAPDGRVTVVRDEDVFDTGIYPSYIFYSDQRAKMFTMPAVVDGAILEYRYRIQIASRTLWHSWNFQDRVPTLVSRFSLVKPSEWDISYRLYGITLQPTVSKAPQGFRSTMAWEARDVPALAAEPAMPAGREAGARLALAPVGFKTWGDVARWYSELASPRMKAGSNIEALAQSLLSGVTDDREKLRRLFEWVRDRVRYIAVEVGIGGYQPHAAEDVCIREYGDCKDMVTLLCALGRSAGLDMRQALISTWQNGKPDTSLASPLHFNHVIAFSVRAEAETLWMDPTEKGCPFGQIPWYDQGMPSLVVRADGDGSLIMTPRALPLENRTLVDWQMNVHASGEGSVSGASSFWGAAAHDLRSDLIETAPAERRLWLETSLARQCSGAMLDSFAIVGLDPPAEPLYIAYWFHTSTVAQPREGSLVLRPGLFAASTMPDYFRSPSRSHPIRLQYGSVSAFKLTVKSPSEWKGIGVTPSKDSLSSAFGDAHWSIVPHDSEIHFRSSYTLYGDDVSPGKYPAFQQFLDAMRQRDLREMILRPVEPHASLP